MPWEREMGLRQSRIWWRSSEVCFLSSVITGSELTSLFTQWSWMLSNLPSSSRKLRGQVAWGCE